jgi:hypothetical protein
MVQLPKYVAIQAAQTIQGVSAFAAVMAHTGTIAQVINSPGELRLQGIVKQILVTAKVKK